MHTQAKALDYEAMSREQRALAAIIREHAGGRRAEPPDKLLMRTQVTCTYCIVCALFSAFKLLVTQAHAHTQTSLVPCFKPAQSALAG